MGILPLQFEEGENGDKLELTGQEKFTIRLDNEELRPRQRVKVEVCLTQFVGSC